MERVRQAIRAGRITGLRREVEEKSRRERTPIEPIE
jgi:hypothetical protein